MLNQDFIKVLYIDLSQHKYWSEERRDLFADYLGGVGVGAKLLEENIFYEEEALSPQQPIIFSNGVLGTIFPAATKVVSTFKSPLTGEYGESHAGGRAALAMRYAGLDAIVLKGKSPYPIYLSLGNDQVQFKDARPLWFRSSHEAGRVIRRLEPGAAHRSIFRLGPAGVKMINYACLTVDTYRHFGRLGLGALFGSKNLVAMVITGDQELPIINFPAYHRIYNQIFKVFNETEVMQKYHEYGTTVNILPLNEMNALPSYNLQKSSFKYAQELSGEAFAEKVLVRKVACIGCLIGCIHLGLYRRQFGEEAEFEYTRVAYDYELVFALGTLLGISSAPEVMSLIERVDYEGLDAIAAGNILAWATEAYQKGLISKEELGTEIDFGQTENYLKVLRFLSLQITDFYQDLAKGTWNAAQKYGGEDFALTLGKNPMAGYHTGYASLLGQAVVGARHSHVDNAGYSLDQKYSLSINPEDIVEKLLQEEKARNMFNCTGICMFARSVYNLSLIKEALAAIGISRREEELISLGDKIFRLKLKIKENCGFKPEEVKIPLRFFETPSLQGILKEEVYQKMLKIYLNKINSNI